MANIQRIRHPCQGALFALGPFGLARLVWSGEGIRLLGFVIIPLLGEIENSEPLRGTDGILRPR